VIWGDQVWLTTATEDGKQQSVYCLDRLTGKILHEQLLFENATPAELGNDRNTYASPSPVIEEGRVYVHFGSYGTACLDTKTFATIWSRRDLPCDHYRGPASSPVLYGDLLILTFDGADHQYLEALSKETGKTVWHRQRGTNYGDLTAAGTPERDGDMLVDSTGAAMAAGGLNLTLRDLARFGELMRNKGRLGGKQIVPESVVAKIEAGADLVQIYTGLIYQGPALVQQAAKALQRHAAKAGR
jgi:glucose dehydrogenase